MKKRFEIVGRITNGRFSDAVRLRIRKAMEQYEDGLYTLTIAPEKKATDPQRKYWFKVIVRAVQEFSGYEMTEEGKQDCHGDLLKLLAPELTRKRVNRLTGEEEDVRVSWTKLSTEDVSEIIERAFVHCATKFDLVIPSPKEYMNEQ